jgi:hypothetical protein
MYSSILLYRHFLPTGNGILYHIPWLWIYIKAPSPQKGKQNCVSDVRILKERRGGFHAQCCGNVLLWPKSDDSKKCLALFYLFTVCFYVIAASAYWKCYLMAGLLNAPAEIVRNQGCRSNITGSSGSLILASTYMYCRSSIKHVIQHIRGKSSLLF